MWWGEGTRIARAINDRLAVHRQWGQTNDAFRSAVSVAASWAAVAAKPRGLAAIPESASPPAGASTAQSRTVSQIRCVLAGYERVNVGHAALPMAPTHIKPHSNSWHQGHQHASVGSALIQDHQSFCMRKRSHQKSWVTEGVLSHGTIFLECSPNFYPIKRPPQNHTRGPNACTLWPLGHTRTRPLDLPIRTKQRCGTHLLDKGQQ